MNKNSQTKTPEKMLEAIFALDLEPIKTKLMDKKEGHGWSRAFADQCEIEYKRFLALLAKFPDEVIAPNNNVDKFWHGHILDTMKYAEDCERVFGYFLHHYPYFGLRGEQDAANLQAAAARMRRLYQEEFGDPAVAGAPSWCCKADENAIGQQDREALSVMDGSVSWCCKADEKAFAQQGREAANVMDGSVSWCCKADEKTVAQQGRAAVNVMDGSVSWCCKADGKVTVSPQPMAA